MKDEGAIKRQDQDTEEEQRSGTGRRVAKGIFLTLFVVLLLGILVGCGYVFMVVKDAPEIDTANMQELLPENSVLYDDQGKTLSSVFSESKRINVTYSEIPAYLRDAFVAVEDKTFWDHHGFNLIRILGAVKEGITSGGKISGTSTITQQLARNLYLMEIRSEYSLKRKVLEGYYAVLLEKNLSKEEIITTYLNRISLGFGTSGVQAAAQAYFSKDVSELTLNECVALAAIPQAPHNFALVRTLPSADVPEGTPDVLFRDNEYAYLYNGEASAERRLTILALMREQGYISEEEFDRAKQENFRDFVNPARTNSSQNASYFTDYAIAQVVEDLAEEYGMTEEEAREKIYNGGLRIYTTLNIPAQQTIESAFADNGNFPDVARLDRDKQGNILSKEGRILLYNFDSVFDQNGGFTLFPGEYEFLANGSLRLTAGKRLHFYTTEQQGETDVSIRFKSMYRMVGGVFYTIEDGILAIPPEYKKKDDDGNAVINADFLLLHPDYFAETAEGLYVRGGTYSLSKPVVQPQAAMVIVRHETGEVIAMAGGRGTEGRMLYNRAMRPRQPGSSIKPISVYGPALQSAAAYLAGGKPELQVMLGEDRKPVSGFSGKYWTAGSVINDAQMLWGGKIWPKNWYDGYRGPMALRTSVEQSVNVNAVKVFSQLGPEYSAEFLENLGISSVVTEGRTNDMNPAALALGGMTEGISPLEMAGAYAAVANRGYFEPLKAYTKVVDRKGAILLERPQEKIPVMDPGAAFILTDILHTTVIRGIAKPASVPWVPVAGKTGTTSDNYDAWFVGFTPQYAASLWIGNDINIELDEGSMAAARLWSQIMAGVAEPKKESGFGTVPMNVIRKNGEYYLRGTEDDSYRDRSIPQEEKTSESAISPKDSQEMPVEGDREENPPEKPEQNAPPTVPFVPPGREEEEMPEWLQE